LDVVQEYRKTVEYNTTAIHMMTFYTDPLELASMLVGVEGAKVTKAQRKKYQDHEFYKKLTVLE